MIVQEIWKKSQCYGFNLFLKNEELDQQLNDIEDYMLTRGWDNIVIQEQELLQDETEINHSVLKQAFNQAKEHGLCGVFNHTPLQEV